MLPISITCSMGMTGFSGSFFSSLSEMKASSKSLPPALEGDPEDILTWNRDLTRAHFIFTFYFTTVIPRTNKTLENVESRSIRNLIGLRAIVTMMCTSSPLQVQWRYTFSSKLSASAWMLLSWILLSWMLLSWMLLSWTLLSAAKTAPFSTGSFATAVWLKLQGVRSERGVTVSGVASESVTRDGEVWDCAVWSVWASVV